MKDNSLFNLPGAKVEEQYVAVQLLSNTVVVFLQQLAHANKVSITNVTPQDLLDM